MLLPSALSCDGSGANHFHSQRLPTQGFFASPPTSPPLQLTNTSNSLFSTCCALQSMLAAPSQLSTPPSCQAPTPSSFKLRLRHRKVNNDSSELDSPTISSQRRRITKRTHCSRGSNKRRRSIGDTEGSDEDSGPECDNGSPVAVEVMPSTPKRLCLAPDILPLGLERADYRGLMEGPDGRIVGEGLGGDGIDWTNEEDRLLVELVLEKLKLSKSDWQDCARSLGRDKGSIGRRWRTLMASGDVGLRRNPTRAKLHATWR